MLKRLWYRIRFALALSDRDIENINWLCDVQLTRVNNERFAEEMHRLHDLAVDAGSWA